MKWGGQEMQLVGEGLRILTLQSAFPRPLNLSTYSYMSAGPALLNHLSANERDSEDLAPPNPSTDIELQPSPL